MGAWQQFLISRFSQEYNRLFLWAPVFFALGLSLYFNLNSEPWLGWGAIAFLSTVFLLYFVRNTFIIRITVLSFFLMSAGYLTAQLKTLWFQTPMLATKMKDVQLQGRIVHIDKRPHDERLTLDKLTFVHWPKNQIKPHRVRVTLRRKNLPLKQGDIIKATTVLLPPESPVVEGGYDMAFDSYFQGIGAHGFMTQPPQAVLSNSESLSLRQTLTHIIRDKMDPSTGPIAAALITGDRTGIPKKLRQSYADAGIAHILAISGLHLSILAGLAFLFIRRGLCFFPWFALNYPTKKWAAFSTILITFGYLLLSGVATPALRAFVMTSLIMLAIIVDRMALTLRNVSLAALCILVLWPEILFHPSFQLSFAAVTSLIAAYEKYRQSSFELSKYKFKVPRAFQYIFGVMVTTLIASLATAPFAAYTFNRFALHSIEANLIAIPLTTFWVMPSALLSVLALPFGLEHMPMKVLGRGIHYLNEIAVTVSNWPGSVIHVAQIPSWALAVFTLGVLWLMIWNTRWKWYGLVGPFILVVAMSASTQPDVFVSKRYGIIGLRQGDTLWMTETSRGRYLQSNWQRVAGLKDIKSLDRHPQFSCYNQICEGEINGKTIALSQHWRARPKRCAAVSLTLSTAYDSCFPDITFSQSELRQKDPALYRLSSNQLHLMSTHQKKKRPWIN